MRIPTNGLNELGNLLRRAQLADQPAAKKLYEKLAVRFTALVARELQRYVIIKNAIKLEAARADIYRQAIQKVQEIRPLNGPQWSLQRVMSILPNHIDDFVINPLTSLAPQGNPTAEELLFRMLRPKSMEHVNKRRADRNQAAMVRPRGRLRSG